MIYHLEEKTYIATPDLDTKNEEKIIYEIENKIKEAEINGIDSIC